MITQIDAKAINTHRTDRKENTERQKISFPKEYA